MSNEISVSRALEHPNFKFLAISTEILKHLEDFITYVQRFIEDKDRIAKASMEYKTLFIIKQLVALKRSDIPALMAELKSHSVFIRRYDRKLADIIDSFAVEEKTKSDFLVYLSRIFMGGNARDIIANYDIIQKKLDELGKQNKVSGGAEDRNISALKVRIGVIKRTAGEIAAIQSCLSDLERWGYELSAGTDFFTSHLNLYFEGGQLENKAIFGLSKTFNDYKLRASVYNDSSVKKFLQLGRVSYRIEEQKKFVAGLIAMISSDVDENKRIWTGQTGGFNKFFGNLGKYSNALKANFKNELFAEWLVKNKEKIGEQPFEWLKVLRSMDAMLKQFDEQKKAVVENARQAIKAMFEQRIQELNKSLQTIMFAANKLVYGMLLSPEESGILRQIVEGIKRIEDTLGKIWDSRRKKLKGAMQKIHVQCWYLNPRLNAQISNIDIGRELGITARTLQNTMEYDKHKEAIVDRISSPTTRKLPLLLMLAFDYARLGDNMETFLRLKNEVPRKLTNVDKDEIEKIKREVRQIVDYYSEALNLIGMFNIELNLGPEHKLIQNFVGDYYAG